MPVVVTGADSVVGSLLVAALGGEGLDLRATVDDRSTVAPLVADGVKTAVSDLVDTERFGAVVEGAHTVIHLRGSDTGSALDGIDDVLAALPESGVQRVVTLAPLAGTAAEHPAVAALDHADVDTVVLHLGVLLAPLADPRSRMPTVGDPAAEVAPLWIGDLVHALVAADRLRDLHGHLHIDAVGTDVVAAGDLLRRLGVARPADAAGDTPRQRDVDLCGDRGRDLIRLLGVQPVPLDRAVEAALHGL